MGLLGVGSGLGLELGLAEGAVTFCTFNVRNGKCDGQLLWLELHLGRI